MVQAHIKVIGTPAIIISNRSIGATIITVKSPVAIGKVRYENTFIIQNKLLYRQDQEEDKDSQLGH